MLEIVAYAVKAFSSLAQSAVELGAKNSKWASLACSNQTLRFPISLWYGSQPKQLDLLTLDSSLGDSPPYSTSQNCGICG
jgi:hypothetical protein